MKGSRIAVALSSAVIMLAVSVASATVVTGDPAADGWTYAGNALANGVYVRGEANYGYEMYSAAMTVQAGSNLVISDEANSWLVGDTVLGVGGRFADITAAEAGWTAFSGNGVNALLGGTDLGADTKLQAKFGSDEANFSASTVAPKAGNGAGSLSSNGGTGALQIRTSAYFSAADWSAKSGVLQLLDKASHIERNGTSAPDADVARLMWNWNATLQRIDGWQILLNTSLLDRLDPSFAQYTPAAGNLALMTVQNRDSAYTDGLLTIVPEPASLVLLASGGLLLLHRRRVS